MATKKVGSAGRFGPRYGTRTKKIVAVMERGKGKARDCPFCERPALGRVAAGIWLCGKCGKKFAGGAYFPKSAVAEEMAKLAEGLKGAEAKTRKGE